MTFFKFGEDVAGYNIPVLNEREIRAAAGIMFVLLFFAFMLIMFKQDFLLVKYVIVVFLADFAARIFFSPRFSPLLIIGRLIVSRQAPEYVGAPPKKFAWSIGLALSGFMFALLVVMNSYSALTLFSCLLCLVFLFFESAFGICLGCIMYGLFYKNVPQYCAGESCNRNKKEAILQVSRFQVFSLAGFIVGISLVVLLFHDRFIESPKNLWQMLNSAYRDRVTMRAHAHPRPVEQVQSNDNDLYTVDAGFSGPLLLR